MIKTISVIRPTNSVSMNPFNIFCSSSHAESKDFNITNFAKILKVFQKAEFDSTINAIGFYKFQIFTFLFLIGIPLVIKAKFFCLYEVRQEVNQYV